MIYHLDTSAAASLIRGRPRAARIRLGEAFDRGDLVALSMIVLFELWYGVAKSSRRGEEAEKLSDFLEAGIRVDRFGGEAAQEAGELKLALRRQPVGPYDLLIAGHALSLGATLVTGNLREFSRVPGLRVEDWSL